MAFDPHMALVARLKRGELSVIAPGLIERAMSQPPRLDFTATAADLSQCDVICICPDVPTNEKGRADLSGIQTLLDDVSAAARPGAVLVNLSAVPPGFSRAQSRKGRAFYYQLEPLVLDEAVERAAEPKQIVVGCADPSAPLAVAFQQFLDLFGCPILPMRYESAELCRFALSLVRVAGANAGTLLEELCKNSGADQTELASVFDDVQSSVRRRSAVGGERDLAALRRLAEKHGVDTSGIEKWLSELRQQRNWVLQCLEVEVLAKRPDAQLAILGLASRQGTTSTEDSAARALIGSLPKLRIRAYDPAVLPDPAWHSQLEAAHDALDACRQADALVIMTPWPEFAALDPAALAGRMRGRVIIDPHRVLEPDTFKGVGMAHFRPD